MKHAKIKLIKNYRPKKMQSVQESETGNTLLYLSIGAVVVALALIIVELF